jgi:molybdopterin biosynthesis enzyme MoaB
MSKIYSAVVTVSDTRSLGDDTSGNKLAELLESADAEVSIRRIVSDDLADIRDLLISIAAPALRPGTTRRRQRSP